MGGHGWRSGFGFPDDGFDHVAEHPAMEGVEGIPVDFTGEAFGGEDGGLDEAACIVFGKGFELEPGVSREFHFGAEAEEGGSLNILDAPEVEGFAGEKLRGVASSPPKAGATEQVVESAPEFPGPVPGHPALVAAEGGEDVEHTLGRGVDDGASDFPDQAFTLGELVGGAFAEGARPAGLDVAVGDFLKGDANGLAVGDREDSGEEFAGAGGVANQRFLHAVDEGEGEAIGDGGNEAHPACGEAGQEHREGNDAAGEAAFCGVVHHHVAEPDGFRADVDDAGGRMLEGLEKVVQGVADGDGLDLMHNPLRGDHDREALGQVANHFEGGGPGTDDGSGAKFEGVGMATKDFAHFGPAGQMFG